MRVVKIPPGIFLSVSSDLIVVMLIFTFHFRVTVKFVSLHCASQGRISGRSVGSRRWGILLVNQICPLNLIILSSFILTLTLTSPSSWIFRKNHIWVSLIINIIIIFDHYHYIQISVHRNTQPYFWLRMPCTIFTAQQIPYFNPFKSH